jgi:hypothetical protein
LTRGAGVIEGPADVIGLDHVCWAYDSSDAFLHAGVAWVQHGLETNRRIVYVADRSEDQLASDLAPLGARFEKAVADGALRLQPLRNVYPNGGPVNSFEQLEIYDGGVREALADGFTGLRVLAEVSALVSDRAWRTAHLTWEQLADDYMTTNALSAFCAYDRRVVGDDTAAALSAVHPARNRAPTSAPFAIYASVDGIRLEGDVDTFAKWALDEALATRPSKDRLVIEIDRDAFLDAGATSVLAKHARDVVDVGGHVEIHAHGAFQRVWEILEFDRFAPIS